MSLVPWLRQASEQGKFTLISTGDKDMAQLVNQNTQLINTMTNVIMDHDMVVEKFGVGPELIIDYLALKGDKVDNIPGVPGVGDKSAVGLLQGIGSIEKIYQQLDDIAGLSFSGAKTLAKKMQEFEQQARLSYDLATIKLDCDLAFDCNDMQAMPQDNERLLEYFSDCEFKRWRDDIENGKSFFSANINHKRPRRMPPASATVDEDKPCRLPLMYNTAR